MFTILDSSSEDETSVVKQSKERKVNPMVQKSHLFKKHRGAGDDSDGEQQDPAGAGHGSTSISYGTSGAELKNAGKDNVTATRNIDTEIEKDFRTITERADEVQKETKDKEDDKIYRGMNNYAQYVEKREAMQGKRIQTKGPIR
jgi:RING finger protein 113A